MLANSISDRLIAAAEEAAIAALNGLAEKIYVESQIEVPKGPPVDQGEDSDRFHETLAQSGRYPGNMPELAAVPGNLNAEVVYDSPYAMAQHEGYAIIRSKLGKEYVWAVSTYTTEGTKSKYLEDPFKAALVELEPLCAAEFETRMAKLSAEMAGIVWE